MSVEILIKNNNLVFTKMDLTDFEFRLDKTVFSQSTTRLKSLGGTYSTNIKFSKSKRNNKVFVGRTNLESINKFNNISDFECRIIQDGALIATGIFKLESITNNTYEGIFYDQNVNWIPNLSSKKLNELGYVDGKPTWLVPFNGASTFNIVNELDNRLTDFICPTIVYNNTPITDYLDLSDGDIWGTFDNNGDRITTRGNYPNEFLTENGLFSTRLGVTFQDMPPAIYYRNLLEKVIDEIGLTLSCSLFEQEWFNKLYMTYGGEGYLYNWKNLATIKAFNEQVISLDLSKKI